MSGVPWAAVQRLGQFAGLRAEGTRLLKSESSEEDDFRALPADVREALVVIGRLAPDPEPVQKAAEFPHGKAAGDAAKAAAGTAVKERESKPLRPGQGRQYATEILGDLVKKLRKDKPNLSEADAWVQVLDTPEGARWYDRGELAEAETRRK